MKEEERKDKTEKEEIQEPPAKKSRVVEPEKCHRKRHPMKYRPAQG